MKIKGTKMVRVWVRPHKVNGYYKRIKKVVYINFKEKEKKQDDNK